MQAIGHPMSLTQLRIKVAEMTQERSTPFRNGIPGQGWLRWFKLRHPELSLRGSQSLEFGRARGLCSDRECSFVPQKPGRSIHKAQLYSISNLEL